MTVRWIHEQDLEQPHKDQLEKVSRKHAGHADNKEPFQAIMQAQEGVRVDFKLYEKEPGNAEAS